MKFDVIIFEGENLADYAEPDTKAIRLDGATQEDALLLTKLVSQQQKNIFICCLPYISEE